MSKSRKFYCACNPRSKPNREEAKWYCYRHRRHLCDNCIYDELNQRHISCMVGTYQSFIKSAPSQISSFKQNKLQNKTQKNTPKKYIQHQSIQHLHPSIYPCTQHSTRIITKIHTKQNNN